MSVTIVIPAAGIGARMNLDRAKQFYMLGDMPVLAHLLKRVDMVDEISEVIVSLREDEIENFTGTLLKQAGIKKPVKTVIGGATRQASVCAALKLVDDASELVMVHDGVRPFVMPDLLQSAIKKTKGLKATIAVVKVTDTIKEVRGGTVVKTHDREHLYAVQTPQTFTREIIMEAYEHASKNAFTGTDDASLVEKAGYKVFVIPGSYDNIKLTVHGDLHTAMEILRKQKKHL